MGDFHGFLMGEKAAEAFFWSKMQRTNSGVSQQISGENGHGET